MSWAEAYDLALQLQEVQSSSGDVRLSDRNCVELVSYLIKKEMVHLIFTHDGREYLTHKQLYIEVEQELEFAKGRIGLIDLCDTLNVSVEHVEPVVKELIRDSSTVYMVNSEIIQLSYIESMAIEVNLKLQESGVLAFGEICSKYDLPVAFVHEHLSKYLGSLIHGFYTQDKLSLMTETHKASQVGKVRGALIATTKPISLKTLSSIIKIPDPMMVTIVCDLIKDGIVDGCLDRGSDINSVFIPKIFQQHQIDSVTKNLETTGILTFNQLAKLAIADPKGFIEKNYQGKLVFLPDCCVTEQMISEPIAALEQCICDSSWLDLGSVMPSLLTNENIMKIYDKCVERNSDISKELFVLCDTVVVSKKFVLGLEKLFHGKVKEKAVKDVRENFLMVEKILSSAAETTNTAANSKKEERKQKAMGKKGPTGKAMSVGGRGGREAKTKKAVKNKFRDRHDDNDQSDSDQEVHESKPLSDKFLGEVLKLTDIENLLGDKFADEIPCDSFCPSLAEMIFVPLRKLYEEKLKVEFERNQVKTVSVTDMQSSLKEFALGLPIIEKALNEFKETANYSQIEQYVLKNECSAAISTLINIILDEYNCSLSNPTDLTPDKRLKLISNIRNEAHKNSLTGLCRKFESFESFSESFLKSCEDCDVYIGKADKKKEKANLSECLKKFENDIANATTLSDLLLSCCLYLFLKTFKAPITLPGKFVANCLEVLKPKVDEKLFELLSDAQKYVQADLKSKDDDTNEKDSAEWKNELFDKLKTQVFATPTAPQTNN